MLRSLLPVRCCFSLLVVFGCCSFRLLLFSLLSIDGLVCFLAWSFLIVVVVRARVLFVLVVV